MMPLISIGILNFNGLERLKKVIPSIIKQKYENLEILVLDNGSTDGSVEFLSGFEKIKVVKNEKNYGAGHGRNVLVKHSSGEYIFLLDNDIELLDANLTSELYNYYQKLEVPGFLAIPLMDVDNLVTTNHYGIYFSTVKKAKKLSDLQKLKCFSPAGFGGFIFFRKDIFYKIGGYDEKYPINNDDYDLSAKAYIYGYRIYMWTKYYAVHHGIENTVNIKTIAWRNQYYLAGFLRMIISTYKFGNALEWIVISSGWIFVKSILDSVKFLNLSPIFTYFKSAWLVLRDLSDTLKRRKRIQRERTVKKDIFLQIHPPK